MKACLELFRKIEITHKSHNPILLPLFNHVKKLVLLLLQNLHYLCKKHADLMIYY